MRSDVLLYSGSADRSRDEFQRRRMRQLKELGIFMRVILACSCQFVRQAPAALQHPDGMSLLQRCGDITKRDVTAIDQQTQAGVLPTRQRGGQA